MAESIVRSVLIKFTSQEVLLHGFKEMAETESIVKSVLIKLTDAVVKEVLLLHGVGEQVETLSHELGRIQALLKDVDKKQITDKRENHWLKEVRDTAYFLEDTIDTFLSEVTPKPQNPASMTEPRKRTLNTKIELPAVHKLVHEITQIQERMIEIEASRRRYGINTLGKDTGEIKLPIRPLVLPDIDPDVVGFKEERQDDETEGCQLQMGDTDLEKRKKDETAVYQLQMGDTDLEMHPEDDTEGRQSQMDVPDLEKPHEDETNGCSIMASLTTTSEGNKDEKLLYIIIGLIGLLATAAGIAAIPVPENSRKKTLGKICSGLFDILVLIFLGAVIILGIYVQISKAKGMKHISISYFVFFFILVVCSILKMVMVAVGDL